MSAPSARLSAVGFLLCIVAASASHLEALLTAHDVRYAIQLHSDAERG